MRGRAESVVPHNTRLVWAAITACPQQSIRAIGRELGIAPSTVFAALHLLKNAGYIDFEPKAARARTVLVPFIVTGKDRE